MIDLPGDPEAAADALIKAFAGRPVANRIRLPVCLPKEQSEDELVSQPCVVIQAGSQTYAGLPIQEAKQAVVDKFQAAIGSSVANLDQFDLGRLRAAEVTWLGGSLVFLPHREKRFEVPFFIGDQFGCLAARENTWIYFIMRQRSRPEPAGIDLLDYVRFFFTTVVGIIGGFKIADRPDDAVWRQEAAEETRQEFASKVAPLRYIGKAEDGRLEVRGTVIFKNALFVTSVLVAPSWEMELTNEELLMENLPIAFGQQVDLLVRR